MLTPIKALTQTDLVAWLQSMPSTASSTNSSTVNDAPAPKRRRVDGPTVPAIHVATSDITLNRPSTIDSDDFELERLDIGQYLTIALFDHVLRISSKSKSPSSQKVTSLRLESGEATKDFIDIMRISRFTKDGHQTPGAIWAMWDAALRKVGGTLQLTITANLFWNETPSPLNGLRTKAHRGVSQDLINTFYPIADHGSTTARSPMDFYDAANVPLKDDHASLSIEVPGLDATLFPYQKRTLQWMLRREGVYCPGPSGIRPLDDDVSAPVSDSSRQIYDVDGNRAFINDTLQVVSSDLKYYRLSEQSVRGGILAEEMGLGKTLELLALILLHAKTASNLRANDTDSALRPSGATLIVAPESLRQQWMTEMSRHAPGLRIMFYKGCNKSRQTVDADGLEAQLACCDVVLTTYSILSAEVHFAHDAPERSRRRERLYERPKSPLVKISWWRLCLDEAQMIENGFSQAASVARLIPRVNAWGISGTPVKNDVKDLYGLLQFLHYQPICSAPQVWEALLKRPHKDGQRDLFQQLFNAISIRHTKALVRDEIALPAQKRYAISIPFTAVEEQHYQSMFKEMAVACEVDTEGNPVIEDWRPDDYEEEMRIWLNRLRQTALHPEVGAYNRRVLGSNKARPMRTVDEVLDAMIEQSEGAIRADQRAYLASRLTRGQLYENSPLVREALSIWESVRKETIKWVQEAREALKVAMQEQKLEDGAKTSDADRSSDSDRIDSDEDSDETEAKGRVGECRRRLRSALELHHKTVFFCASAYFQVRDNEEMTEPESDEFNRIKKLEDEGYEEAKLIRKEILRESHNKASRLMNKLKKKASKQAFANIPELKTLGLTSIESSRVVDVLEVLYEELNAQANFIDELREGAVQLLLKKLFDEDDAVETTGEELGEAAKIQDELMAYTQVLRATIADRLDVITGQTNELVKHETKTSIQLAKNGEGPAPVKLLELMEQRNQVKPKEAMSSMRGAISEFRSIVSRLTHEKSQTLRVTTELHIASEYLQKTQAALAAQTKAATALESEIETFSAVMNARLAYYSQLQSVSDSVLPYEGSRTTDAIERMAKAEEDIRRKLASAEAKHRYLLNLKEAGSKSNEPRICVICQAMFETGVLTVCGHQFCKECMMMWYKAHRNCPVCKRHLAIDQMHDITMKPQEIKVHSENHPVQGSEDSPRREVTRKQTMIYSEFNAEKLAEIKNIELDGPSYTTKVDTLVRHLMWLRESDPGAKSIIFSQYKDFLSVLTTAFRRFRIGFASIDSHGGTIRFKEDPAAEVFLLHARAHASGLNLVNASHVFLCEPLVNTALELQAIARVDRIGQEHETTVWLYLTAGTVEESIYNLSVKRRMEHMGRRKLDKKDKSKESTPELLDANLEAANTLEMEHAALSKLMSKDKSAGEVVAKGDLWECLFGHVSKSIPEA